ncbi:hypothetical protein OIO90_000735 [Microbotryomycetes sp. JL221]|nr:hypothetical protein OIO90_000735 [Microbotryomycetes sp. JL221]
MARSRRASSSSMMGPLPMLSMTSSSTSFATTMDNGSTSGSSSAYDSASDFWSRASSSASPASSIGSSPAFQPKDPFSSPVLDLLSLDSSNNGTIAAQQRAPNVTTRSAYAASIIRNEAYALLALAARLQPVAHPVVDRQLVDDDGAQVGSVGVRSDASSDGSQSPPTQTTALEETRTNTSFNQVVDMLSQLPAHGKVIVTGVGKSGIAARKMVATFNSLGIPSVFLHPVEALHGDLGCICPCSPSMPCDALLLISHSGATAELMRLLPIVRSRVRHVVAVTRDPDSVLARACGGWLDAGTGAYVGPTRDGGHKYTDEADSLLPAPTSSVVCVLAIGDALGLTLSRLRIGWDKDGKGRRAEFFRCHPGGQLGIELGREGRGFEPASSTANTVSVPAAS